MTNTVAYYGAEIIMSVKSFIRQAPGAYLKTFNLQLMPNTASLYWSNVSNARLLDLTANIRLGWKWPTVNKRTRSNTALLVITFNSFIVKALSGNAGNTKGGSITVPLTSCLIGLESAL